MKLYYADDRVELWHGDIRDGLPLRFEPVACVVTSPPYNVGLDYDVHQDALGWPAYQALGRHVIAELDRVTQDGARVWLNVANVITASPTLGLGDDRSSGLRVGLAQLWNGLLSTEGFRVRDWVAWVSNREPATAWGSWESPSAPNLRGGWETIIVASKGPWARDTPPQFEGWRDQIGGWAPLTSNVWRIHPEHRSEHPAPFPVELPARCIRLSTWPDELVVDPFAGTGTTLLAARQLGRRALGVELSERYCEIAATRLSQQAFEFGGAA